MKFVVILACILCMTRSFISMLTCIIDGIIYNKPFIINMLIDAFITGCIIFIGVYACRYAYLIDRLLNV